MIEDKAPGTISAVKVLDTVTVFDEISVKLAFGVDRQSSLTDADKVGNTGLCDVDNHRGDG